MTKPNFFIVGAPKTGSTALYSYLEQHSRIFMSNPKELFFFDPHHKQNWAPTTEEAYLSYFKDAVEEKEYLAIGEGSTTYLSSKQAIQDLYKFNPDAKIIAMVRNPIEMIVSLHNHLYYRGDEDVEDFAMAWRLQEQRANGECIAPKATFPMLLQYTKIGRLGEQISYLYDIFPHKQIKVIVFDDFKEDPRLVYTDTLKFLDVPDDGRDDFPRVYESREVQRGHWIIKWLANPPASLHPIKTYIKSNHSQVIDSVRRLLTSKSKRNKLQGTIVNEMVIAFENDVAMLSNLVDRDLTSWLRDYK